LVLWLEEAIETQWRLLKGTLPPLNAFDVGRYSSKSSGQQSNEIRWSGYAQPAEISRPPGIELPAASNQSVQSGESTERQAVGRPEAPPIPLSRNGDHH
jgi:hypothetical protein